MPANAAAVADISPLLAVAVSIANVSVPVLIVLAALVGALSVGATGTAIYWKLQTGFRDCKQMIQQISADRVADARRIDRLESFAFARAADERERSSRNAKTDSGTGRRARGSRRR